MNKQNLFVPQYEYCITLQQLAFQYKNDLRYNNMKGYLHSQVFFNLFFFSRNVMIVCVRVCVGGGVSLSDFKLHVYIS